MSTALGTIRDALQPEALTLEVAEGVGGTVLVIAGPKAFVLKFWLDRANREALITLLQTASQYADK